MPIIIPKALGTNIFTLLFQQQNNSITISVRHCDNDIIPVFKSLVDIGMSLGRCFIIKHAGTRTNLNNNINLYDYSLFS